MLKLMPPNQPPTPPNPLPTGQYDFILNPQQSRNTPGFGGGSMKSRLFLVAGLAVVLIVGAIIVSAILSRANSGPINNLKSVIAQQQGIIRVAEIGLKDAKSTDSRSFALTVLYSVTTDQ